MFHRSLDHIWHYVNNDNHILSATILLAHIVFCFAVGIIFCRWKPVVWSAFCLISHTCLHSVCMSNFSPTIQAFSTLKKENCVVLLYFQVCFQVQSWSTSLWSSFLFKAWEGHENLGLRQPARLFFGRLCFIMPRCCESQFHTACCFNCGLWLAWERW